MHRMTRTLFCILIGLVLGLPAAGNPYAVCAHLSRPGEFGSRMRELAMMRDIGLGAVRTDFDWEHVEPERGKWTFDHLDKLLDAAEKTGMTVLPILNYEVAWARRPWADESIGLWRRYVRTVVSRYAKRCRVWEVWNEPNATQEGQHPMPSPAEYVKLLRAAREEIKAVDPGLRIAIGGFANVPYDYIEGVYRAGGKDAFDIMNVHPYQWTARAEGKMEKQYEGLRALMAKYGDSGKSVWATEIGLETRQAAFQSKGFLKAVLRRIDPHRRWRILQIVNDALPARNIRRHDPMRALLADEFGGTGYTFDICAFGECRSRLSAGEHDAVILPFTEEFPAEATDDLVRFVAAGGTLIETGGMAFFQPAGTDAAKRFRFRNAAWFTDGTLPKSPRCKAADGFDYAAVLPRSPVAESRFFEPDGLKAGDAFIPLMTAAASDGRQAASAAWIRYGSDMKGNLVLAGFFERGIDPFDEEEQGIGCARQLNLAFALGYEKVFWYEFLSCSGFGIVNRRDFSPRPAYRAYGTFVESRPARSVQLDGEWKSADGDVYFPRWRLPNGAVAGALWSVSGKGAVPTLPELKAAVRVTDYLGRELKGIPKSLPDAPIYYRTAPRPEGAPYGYDSHLIRPEEYPHLDRELSLIGDVGAGWFRTGLRWDFLQKVPGEGGWDFSVYDDVIDRALARGVSFLPILHVQSATRIQIENPGLWCDYVRRCVERYCGRISHWEVWNEVNIDEPPENRMTPEEYAELLGRTYRTIKSCDPNARVACSGFAGIPLEYIERLYGLGAKDSFDIMNVHLYPRTHPEGSIDARLENLRMVMAKYGDGGKPVWLTETGLRPGHEGLAVAGFAAEALKAADPSRRNWRILLVEDDARRLASAMRLLKAELPACTFDGCNFRSVERRLAETSPDALFLPLNCTYPADAMDAVTDYVARGGTLVDMGGFSMYQPCHWKRTGRMELTDGGGHADRRRLRFEVVSPYSDGRYPHQLGLRPTGSFGKVGLPRSLVNQRYFRPEGLKAGDRFEPLLVGTTSNGLEACSAAIIRYGSDMKGRLVLSGWAEPGVAPVTRDDQAVAVARNLSIAFAAGYEKVFWYSLCDCFGLVDPKDLDGGERMPGQRAYKAFVLRRPAGSVNLPVQWRNAERTVFWPQWRRPDGSVAGAIWSVTPCRLRVRLSDKAAFYDHLGDRIPPPLGEAVEGEIGIGPEPIFFEGARLEPEAAEVSERK